MKDRAIDVYHWPEFKALAARLGIDCSLQTTCITITLPVGGMVKVVHEYNASEVVSNRPTEVFDPRLIESGG